MSNADLISEVAAALERDKAINLHSYPLRFEFSDGVLTMEGEVEHIMAKKQALGVAASIAGVDSIVDRLRLVPSEMMQDGEIRDHVCNSLLSENMLGMCAIRALVKGQLEVIKESDQGLADHIDVEVKDGIVILNGAVFCLSSKRLAGALAWWVPGSRDVVNGIEILPPEEDHDDEVIDGVRLVLEKDPFVNASQIRVKSSQNVVILEGMVRNNIERRMAEADACYVFGVDHVVNLLEVEE